MKEYSQFIINIPMYEMAYIHSKEDNHFLYIKTSMISYLDLRLLMIHLDMLLEIYYLKK